MSLDWDLDNVIRKVADENDNRLADILAADANFVLMQMRSNTTTGHELESTMDLDRVGIAGHSRGGKTVGRACSKISEIGACAVLDNVGPARERITGIEQPFLTLRSDWDQDRVAELHDYLRRTGSVSHDVVLLESNHFSCTDIPLFMPDLRIAGKEPADQIRTCARILAGFFEAFLPGTAATGTDWIPEDLEDQLVVQRFEQNTAN